MVPLNTESIRWTGRNVAVLRAFCGDRSPGWPRFIVHGGGPGASVWCERDELWLPGGPGDLVVRDTEGNLSWHRPRSAS